MARPGTIHRDFKSPPPGTRARWASYHPHLLTIAGIVLGASLVVALLPDDAGAVRAQADDPTDSPAPSALSATDRTEDPDGDRVVQAMAAQPASPTPLPGDAGDWIEDTVRPGDSLSRIFARNGLTDRDLYRVMAAGGDAGELKRIHPGNTIRLRLDDGGALLALAYDLDATRIVRIERGGDDGAYVADLLEREVETRTTYARGDIRDSLFLAANRAGLSDNLTMELAHIFGWDIDFSLDIREDDRFSVVYEELWLDGKKLRDGRILAAEFVNRGKTFRAIRYTDAAGRTDYYAPDGRSMRKVFLRSPVEFTRVSSRFTTGRMHPVLNRIRAHKGVDYAAPHGTPIKATGDGRIVTLGVNGGYGKTVVIQHGTRYSTLYAHLSRFARGLREGSRVKQGQVIGYVGSTGLATGPHLHYEFRVDGVHRDPLRVKLPEAAPVGETHMAAFRSHAMPLLAQLDTIGTMLAAGDAPPADGSADRVALTDIR